VLALATSALAMDFDAFVAKFGKKYDSKEYELRKTIFSMNKLKIDTHNNKKHATYKLGFTKFADMTTAEFDAFRGYKKVPATGHSTFKALHGAADAATAPDSVDWRTVSNPAVLSPVKNQGQCGSCWAFSAIESIESAGALFVNEEPKILSAQQIVDCAPNPKHCGGTGGCEGSTAELAFSYQKENNQGPILETEYPYTATDGKCQTVEGISDYRVTDFVVLDTNDYDQLIAAVAKQPISVSVDAASWSLYSDGIFDGCNQKQPDIDHAVQLVGYGSEDGKDYWIVRNSWGDSWGEGGFIRLARFDPTKSATPCGMDITPEDGSACEGETDPVKVCGTCGILVDSTYPIVSGNK
jgi:cathepsin L